MFVRGVAVGEFAVAEYVVKLSSVVSNYFFANRRQFSVCLASPCMAVDMTSVCYLQGGGEHLFPLKYCCSGLRENAAEALGSLKLNSADGNAVGAYERFLRQRGGEKQREIRQPGLPCTLGKDTGWCCGHHFE